VSKAIGWVWGIPIVKEQNEMIAIFWCITFELKGSPVKHRGTTEALLGRPLGTSPSHSGKLHTFLGPPKSNSRHGYSWTLLWLHIPEAR